MKFLLSKELGRLAKWLRILGYDSAYYKEDKPASLIIQALRDNRIILTRNHRLAQASGVRIVLLKAEQIKEQIAEVLKELKIRPEPGKMFSRCTVCNIELEAADKDRIKERIPEYVFKTQNDFFTCPECKRIYWQGTHWGNVTKTLNEIRA